MNFYWERSNTMGNLEELRVQIEELEELWQLPFKTMFVLQLTIDELITNAVMHCKRNANIQLHVEKKEDYIEIIIKDDACPFNPLELKEPDITAKLEDRCPGGLGIHLVRKQSRSFEYRRENEHNVVTITIDNIPQQP